MATVRGIDTEKGGRPVSEETMPARYAERVGERLQAVEASSRQEFKASVLGAYERGERSISVPRLQRLAAFYHVPVDQLLPRDADDEAGGDSHSPGAGPGKVRIDLVRLLETEGPECTV